MTGSIAPQVKHMLAEALVQAEPVVRAGVQAPDWSAVEFASGDRAAIRKAFFSFPGEVPVDAYEKLKPGTPEWNRTVANEAAEMCLKAVNAAEDKQWSVTQARVEAIQRIIRRAPAAP